MHLLTVLLGVAVIGSALSSDALTLSDDACHSRRRFLVTAEDGASPVFVREREKVDLVCRPADDAGCRWTSRAGNVLSEDCMLTSSGRGVFQCRQGDSLIGSVELRESGHRIYSYRGYDNIHRYASYKKQQKRLRSAHVCSDTGKLIERQLLCDGTRHCENGEDEEGCGQPCGPPATGGGSSLTTPAHQLYPHGASVSYTCPPGLGFHQTLGEYRRTCHEGLWSGLPPACHRNLAFGRLAISSGRTAPGLGPEAAVDGLASTWTMLTPGIETQSLNVSLAVNVSVDLVLVRTLSPRYEVALEFEGNRVSCKCNRNVTKDPELTGLATCACPTNSAIGYGGSSLIFEIPSSEAALLSLAVAEIAAFDVPSPVADECQLLDRPAHGRFETADDGILVRLVCEAGYRASCTGALFCDEAVAAVCRPITCPSPPVIPQTVIASSNGTGWSAVTEYQCAAGYQLYPPQQRTTSVCTDGLWSLSNLSCLPESDIRVVAQRLGQQHARGVAELRGELKTLLAAQLKLQQQLKQTQRRLQRVEQMLTIARDEELEQGEMEQEERVDVE